MFSFLKKKKKPESRNYAASDIFININRSPIYTDFEISKAVREGYAVNAWVYVSVFKISKAISSIPFFVSTEEGKWVDHPLNAAFKKPNPFFSRQDLFELISSWLLLCGNSYLKKVRIGRKTVEFWPISPDRISPIPSKNVNEFISGYALDGSASKAFDPEEIIHHKFINPANPFIGIGNLKVAGKAIDSDVAQQDFNVVTSQNRGVVDGVFTFKREFDSQDDTDAIAEKINEKYGRKRGFIVLGGDASYVRTAMTPVEMDFKESRKFNREEIFIIFGVPPQLAGVQEYSTYNNYQVSERIFWNATIIPLLEDLADTFTMALSEEIREDHKICFDVSGVAACQQGINDKADAAKKFYDMGVPFKLLNDKFSLGIEPFDGWEKPFSGRTESILFQRASNEKRTSGDKSESNRVRLASLLDDITGAHLKKAETFFLNMKDKVFSMDFKELDFAIFKQLIPDFKQIFGNIFWDAAAAIYNFRGSIEDEISKYMDAERYLLKEFSFMEENTITTLLEAIKIGLDEGKSVQDIQKQIEETGLFNPIRANRLARTIAGTAGNTANHAYYGKQGASLKRWVAAMVNTRNAHIERNGEEREISDRFSAKFGMNIGPLYPMDPILVPADRINCRCALDYF